jgi:hypothetical protein
MSARIDMLGASKTSKVQRYGWRVVDEPGSFMMIPKDDLTINREAYQREQTLAKVQRLTAEWSWMACGVLTVALRDDAFWVIDGAHRQMAAMRRADISDLPCLVFSSADVAEEALGFVRANQNRKPITAVERLRAMATSGDAIAQKIEKLASSAGRRVAKQSKPHTLTCVAEIEKSLRADERAFMEIWPLLVQITEGAPMHRDLVKGLFYCHRNMEGGQDLTMEPWRSRVVRNGATGLLDHMQKAKAFHGKLGDRTLAQGVIAAINKHSRGNHAALSRRGDDA